MTRDELLETLIECDGAILYWQLPKDAVEAAIANGDAYIADDDCLVHKDAIAVNGGYVMPSRQDTCQHRDSGRGVCIDCGKFLP